MLHNSCLIIVRKRQNEVSLIIEYTCNKRKTISTHRNTYDMSVQFGPNLNNIYCPKDIIA